MAVLDYYAEDGLSAVYYDLITSVDPTAVGDIDFYASLLPEGAAVLELGCGTGRVALALAARGHTVVGLDLAPAMAKRAVLKLRRLAPEDAARASFVVGDMTEFSLGRTFDAVLVPYFAFAHLPPGAPRERALDCINRHLAPGGLAAMQLPLASVQRVPTGDEAERAYIDLVFDAEGRRLSVSVVDGTWEPQTGRYEVVLDYRVRAGDGSDLKRSRERLGYFAGDPTVAAAQAGLILEQKISPFNGLSEMFVFRRPA